MRPARIAASVRFSQDMLGALTMAPHCQSKSHAPSYNLQYSFYIRYLPIRIALGLNEISPRADRIYNFSCSKPLNRKEIDVVVEAIGGFGAPDDMVHRFRVFDLEQVV